MRIQPLGQIFLDASCLVEFRDLPLRFSVGHSNTGNRAILDLKNQRDKLHQYQKRITVLTDRETAIAKECLARNDRRRALLALRRKKYQESLLAKTDAQLAQLEQLTSQVEFALVQKDVVFGLQQGTKVLQAIQKEIGGLEGIEKLMGETKEARAYQEVGTIILNLRNLAIQMLTSVRLYRKSVACSLVRCPIKMRTKSRMSSRPWNERFKASIYPMLLQPRYLKKQRKRKHRRRKRERRRERKSELPCS